VRIALLSWFLVVSFAWAQQTSTTQWLFPDDQALLRSAKIGFLSTKELPFVTIYERRGLTFKEEHTGCPERVDEVQAAGPLMLAALLGRKAKIQSSEAPSTDKVRESRGALLLSVKFYARKQDTQTEIELWQDEREYTPVSKHVNRIINMGCKFSSAPFLRNAPGDYRYRVEQAFIFRFAPQTEGVDWDRPFKLLLHRTDGEVEEYALSFADAFIQEAHRLR
jgi:hypothetical protein